MNFVHFCEFWCFSLGKQARFTLHFCSGMPLWKVHELAFLWFGLPGPLLILGGDGGIRNPWFDICTPSEHQNASRWPIFWSNRCWAASRIRSVWRRGPITSDCNLWQPLLLTTCWWAPGHHPAGACYKMVPARFICCEVTIWPLWKLPSGRRSFWPVLL